MPMPMPLLAWSPESPFLMIPNTARLLCACATPVHLQSFTGISEDIRLPSLDGFLGQGDAAGDF